ncbi:MAG: hypothetical protein V4576_00525 [Patescibacteria group bacterium]
MFQLSRVGNKPVLQPDKNIFWETEGVFNAGVTEFEGKNGKEILMLYRAVGEKDAYVSHFGLATSKDGITFERVTDKPVFGPSKPYDLWATEDPRITKIEDEYYITYVAVADRIMDHGRSIEREIPLETRTALLKTKDFLTYEHLGIITPPGADDKDTVLFPKKIPCIDPSGNMRMRYGMLHRPHRWSKDWLHGPFAAKVPIELPFTIDDMPQKPSVWIAWSDDLIHWDMHTPLMKPAQVSAAKNGPGLPPIETPDGWLVIYHHVTEDPLTKRLTYTARAALFELENPTKYVGKLAYNILSPEVSFETEHGAAIVFPTGGFVKDDILYVYYGCSDTYIALATGSLSELIAELKKAGPPAPVTTIAPIIR